MINHRAYLEFCFNKTGEEIPQELTPNEEKVYNMLRVGYPIDTIATRLKVRRSTIENYVREIKIKNYEI